MRLSKQEQQTIKSVIQRYDPRAKVMLFGSRTDDNARGGDIDLLVITQVLGFPDKLHILADLHQQLGEQKIDLLLDDGQGAFAQSVWSGAIEL